jgi:hypothetical protein
MLLAAVCTKGIKFSYSVDFEWEHEYTATPFVVNYRQIWESAVHNNTYTMDY